MSGTVIGRVCEFFAAGARDVTPPDLRGDARVLFVPACASDQEACNTERLACVLSHAERSRARLLKKASDRVRFLKGRAFRRYCGAVALGGAPETFDLASVNFAATTNGRPYLPELPGVWFSFSASANGHLAAWSASHALGVDVEDAASAGRAVEMARYHFSGAEADAVARAPGPMRGQIFLQLWTLKEAALKSIGEGLPYGLDAFRFEVVPSVRIVHAPEEHGGVATLRARLIDLVGGYGALVLRQHRASVGADGDRLMAYATG